MLSAFECGSLSVQLRRVQQSDSCVNKQGRHDVPEMFNYLFLVGPSIEQMLSLNKQLLFSPSSILLLLLCIGQS